MLVIAYLWYKGCDDKIVIKYNLDNDGDHADFTNLVHRIEVGGGCDIRHYEFYKADRLTFEAAKEL